MKDEEKEPISFLTDREGNIIDVFYEGDSYKEKIEENFKDEIKVVKTEYSGAFKAKSIILCMGAAARKLGAKNEEELKGKGVCYCAICDGAIYRDRVVAVVGGGDSAMEDATYLTSVAKKVYLIHRRNEFRGNDKLVAEFNKKNPEVSELAGENK